MTPRPLGLAALVRPLDPEAFLADVRDREPRHFPGDDARFAQVFSFAELERLLGMWRLWSDRTFKVVLDGRDLPPEEFCTSGHGREGHPAVLVDARRVEALLARGATLVLDAMESLSPGVRAVADALRSALGGSVICNVYCSFESHAGFPSHYDTTEVLALHIAGRKRWRVYRERAEQPLERPGHSYAYQDRAHHERAKGAVLEEVEMTPGDVLYLPRGQYHDALASEGASLHLSFGITRASAPRLPGCSSPRCSSPAICRRPSTCPRRRPGPCSIASRLINDSTRSRWAQAVSAAASSCVDVSGCTSITTGRRTACSRSVVF